MCLLGGAEGNESTNNQRTRRDSRILVVALYYFSFSSLIPAQRQSCRKPHSSCVTVRTWIEVFASGSFAHSVLFLDAVQISIMCRCSALNFCFAVILGYINPYVAKILVLTRWRRTRRKTCSLLHLLGFRENGASNKLVNERKLENC